MPSRPTFSRAAVVQIADPRAAELEPPPLRTAGVQGAESRQAIPSTTSRDPVTVEPETVPVDPALPDDESDDIDHRLEIQNAALIRDLVQAMAPSAQECLASELDYAGSAIARVRRTVRCSVMRRIVPSFPAASRPSKTITALAPEPADHCW